MGVRSIASGEKSSRTPFVFPSRKRRIWFSITFFVEFISFSDGLPDLTSDVSEGGFRKTHLRSVADSSQRSEGSSDLLTKKFRLFPGREEIGRASCRERV